MVYHDTYKFVVAVNKNLEIGGYNSGRENNSSSGS